MTLDELKNKAVTVVGLGLTGQSCVRFLLSHGAIVMVMDSRSDVSCDLDVPVLLGDYQEQALLQAQLIVLSPGVNPRHDAIRAAQQAGVEIIGDVELFARFNTIPVIAITGSNGKSTVTELTNFLLNHIGFKAIAGGNIGTPVLDLLNADADYLVLELSSFQLETLSSLKPEVAMILNVSEDHLDRHLTLDAYTQAKLNVYQGARFCLANRDDSKTWPSNYQEQFSFGLSYSDSGFGFDSSTQAVVYQNQPLVYAKQIQLSGLHNMLNVQAALACIHCLGMDLQKAIDGLSAFAGLPHRFELVSTHKQVRWINDSKATNVGATIAAIMSVGEISGKLILIAGGDGKNADFSELQPILLQQVDLVITLGKDGSKIAALKPGSVEVNSLEEAVAFAERIVDSGDVVLLSPACASLDMFDNYQHRGDVFRQTIGRLAA